MTSYEKALGTLERVAEDVRSGDTYTSERQEDILLYNAVGRVAAADYTSPAATPRFDTSAMDGYAVCSEATTHASPENPLILQVRGSIAAGDEPVVLNKEVFHGFAEPCLEIMTGGIFPNVADSKRQFDACVRIEDTAMVSNTPEKGCQIMITKPVLPDANRRFAGCDMQAGEKILRKGDTIRSSHILPLASVGATVLKVFRKPRVAVWSTGKELVSRDASHIPDINGPFLMAALQELGAEPKFLGILNDNEMDVREALQEAVDGNQFDMVITSGGVSVGKYDFIAPAVISLGGTVCFHGVSIRPGHPVLFAQVPSRFRNIPFFGLPGNPGATAACFRFLVAPFMRHLHEQPTEKPIMAKFEDSWQVSSGCKKTTSPGLPPLTHFRHGILRQDQQGDMVVELSKQQSPAKLGPFTSANCWVQMSGSSYKGLVPCYSTSSSTSFL
ncbi:molybdopterin biosynthesis protein [Colletotrichum truncatum]|uniref:Molybdopterin biosynthesis protein n=1 Tax=Colletotrichum truncatum TaxID=5467 RepID=A0ACC3YSC5_COLTU|nr:molybdopterin biosynthesis protein [Colletotrichum truncatum]KAF6789819.1 molybdopterin biosynthesis protein [Colletotrichum truncatum]